MIVVVVVGGRLGVIVVVACDGLGARGGLGVIFVVGGGPVVVRYGVFGCAFGHVSSTAGGGAIHIQG